MIVVGELVFRDVHVAYTFTLGAKRALRPLRIIFRSKIVSYVTGRGLKSNFFLTYLMEGQTDKVLGRFDGPPSDPSHVIITFEKSHRFLYRHRHSYSTCILPQKLYFLQCHIRGRVKSEGSQVSSLVHHGLSE